MSKTDDIKDYIQQGNLDEAMAMAMSEALRIEILTMNNQDTDSIPCHSIIDLLENEREHQLGDKNLQKVHFSELNQAHNRILQNVQSLQEMFNLLETNLETLS